jgi:phasin family protein
MAAKTEHLSEIHRKNMEAAMRLAQLSIDNSQRVMALQSELARELLQDSVENAQAQTAAGDPQEMLRLRAAYTQETARKMMAAAQKIAEVGNEARAQFSRLMTEQLAADSQEMIDAFQSFFAALPGQNASVMDSMRQAMATANNAFEQIAQASASVFGQVNEMARTGAPDKK